MFFLSDILIVGATYICMTAYENIIHRLAHNKKTGFYYEWHKQHHIDYPPHKPESDIYINTSGFHNHFIYSILISWYILYKILSLRTFIIFVSETSLYAFSVDYLHKQFHLKNSWLKRCPWFQKYKQIHLIHHMNPRKNFNFYDTSFDKMNNTYKNI